MCNDLMGNPIGLGDTVAWAAVAGRSAYVKVGIVTKLSDNGGFSATVTEPGSLGHPTRFSSSILYSERTLIIKKADNE